MYENRIVAFVDILGTSNAIKETVNNGVENKGATEDIYNLLKSTQEELNKIENYNTTIKNSKITNHFSDSIVISDLVTKESGVLHILVEILFLCTTALEKNFFLRGAIVCDQLCHTKDIIFGPALIDAYKKEKDLAIYPRILIDEKVLDIAQKYPAKWLSKTERLKIEKKLIAKDFDGLNYINYFDGINYIIGEKDGILTYLKLLRTAIINMRKDMHKDISIKSKYLWLKEKYNTVLTKYKRKYSKENKRLEFPGLCDYIENATLF